MRKIFIAFTSIILMASCSKTNTVQPIKTTKELLTANDWLMSSYIMLPGLKDPNSKDTLTDIFADYAKCDKDDYFTFRNNDTVVFNEGLLFCTKYDVQEYKGLFTVEDNNHFTTIFPNDTIHYTILELNENTLGVKYENYLQNQKQVHTIVYVKK